MKHFDAPRDDIEQRIANDRVPLPTSLRPRILAAVGEALENATLSPLRPSPPWREETVVLATSILLAAFAILIVVPSLVAIPHSATTIASPLEAQARRLGVELPPPPSRPSAFEDRVVTIPSRPAPPSLTPADAHRFLSAPF
jgi:hypothetical protein